MSVCHLSETSSVCPSLCHTADAILSIQYQAKRNENVADVGPTIQQQLDLEPFTRVISSPNLFLGLIAIHTTSCDLYCRLWVSVPRWSPVVFAVSSRTLC